MPLSSLLRWHELHRPQLEADCASGVRELLGKSPPLWAPSPPVQTERNLQPRRVPVGSP